MDLSRFGSGFVRAILASEETGYGKRNLQTQSKAGRAQKYGHFEKWTVGKPTFAAQQLSTKKTPEFRALLANEKDVKRHRAHETAPDTGGSSASQAPAAPQAAPTTSRSNRWNTRWTVKK